MKPKKIAQFFSSLPVFAAVNADGVGNHRHGRTGFSSPPSNGYNSGGAGGIFQAGYQSDNADFGNTYSASNDVASSDDDNLAMLEKAVPGVPGEDYPIYAEVPETAFSCDGQVDGGYYSDPEAECQAFHICTTDGQGGLTKYSFLCPNGTLFSQEYFICDWWFNFDCAEAEALYSLNEDIAAEREAASQALDSQASYNPANLCRSTTIIIWLIKRRQEASCGLIIVQQVRKTRLKESGSICSKEEEASVVIKKTKFWKQCQFWIWSSFTKC